MITGVLKANTNAYLEDHLGKGHLKCQRKTIWQHVRLVTWTTVHRNKLSTSLNLICYDQCYRFYMYTMLMLTNNNTVKATFRLLFFKKADEL